MIATEPGVEPLALSLFDDWMCELKAGVREVARTVNGPAPEVIEDADLTGRVRSQRDERRRVEHR